MDEPLAAVAFAQLTPGDLKFKGIAEDEALPDIRPAKNGETLAEKVDRMAPRPRLASARVSERARGGGSQAGGVPVLRARRVVPTDTSNPPHGSPMAEEQLLFSFEGAAPALEPSDAGERRRALDPARSFIVQAPAGSGKTELLIQRYLMLLPRVSVPESVVAITFTVKAAAEMRERVLDALETAAGPAPEAAHAKETWTLAREALEQDRRLGWSLRENPGRMRIQTIDALSMAIVRQMPWIARMGAMPEVTEDARRFYEQAAENTIRALAEDSNRGRGVETLLRHLDFDAGITRGLIAEMLAIRDHWLPVIGVNADTRGIRATLERSLSRIVRGRARSACRESAGSGSRGTGGARAAGRRERRSGSPAGARPRNRRRAGRGSAVPGRLASARRAAADGQRRLAAAREQVHRLSGGWPRQGPF